MLTESLCCKLATKPKWVKEGCSTSERVNQSLLDASFTLHNPTQYSSSKSSTENCGRHGLRHFGPRNFQAEV
eukprot:4597807-Amphidinium_carterae.1